MVEMRAEHAVRFGVFVFDCASGDLWKEGRRVRMQNQPRLVLRVLLSRPGELVTREELRRQLWLDETFVDFDNGLNVAIRKIRDALGDSVVAPRFIETERAVGYRFIAPVTAAGEPESKAPSASNQATPSHQAPAVQRLRPRRLVLVAATVAVVAALSIAFVATRSRTAPLTYTQLTNFTDSAVAPTLSPDGRMVAFFRSSEWFLSPDQVWIKMLPDGDPVQLTRLSGRKYGLTFSPDGSRIGFTITGPPGWRTMTVPVLGGEPTLMLLNASGLGWIGPDQILFSEIKAGMHMGIATARENRAEHRALYFPAHERAMAHYSALSPDRRWVLVVEMDQAATWQPCRVLPFDGSSPGRQVGPQGSCTAAAWSPDGQWMYFTAVANGTSHLWRQRFAKGTPEQLTSGPMEEAGIAMFPDGRSLITSVGVSQNALWIHDARGDRQLTTQGHVETEGAAALPQFSSDGKYLYYLLRHESPAAPSELWRVDLASDKSERMVPGFSMLQYDISPNGEEVVFWVQPAGRPSRMWRARLGGDAPPTPIGEEGDASPNFVSDGEIVFRMTDRNVNYLGAMNIDGSSRRKVTPSPISDVHRTSPDGRWVILMAAFSGTPGAPPTTLAVPLDGDAPRVICPTLCSASWSPDARVFQVKVNPPSLAGAGTMIVFPLRDGEMLPHLPAGGLTRTSGEETVPGARIVREKDWTIRGIDDTYAFVRSSTHRNLFRVTLP